MTEKELEKIFKFFGDEVEAKYIARNIIKERLKNKIDTKALVEIIDVCQYYAKRIPMQYGNYNYSSLVPSEHRITAYCKPIYTQDGPNIYDH